MNCHEFIALLDARDARTRRADAAAHVRACPDCRAAKNAMQALADDDIPALEPVFAAGLLGRFEDSPQTTRVPSRRAAVGAALALAGGLVFAAIVVLAPRTPDAPAPAAESGEAGEPARRRPAGAMGSEQSLIELIDAAERDAIDALAPPGPAADPFAEGEYFPVLKVLPVYPAAAAAEGLEGEAVVEFTITADGDVADVTVVRSSDPVFEAPSIEAAEQFKYKPRIEDGAPVAVTGVRNRLSFSLEGAADRPSATGAPAADSSGAAKAPGTDEMPWTEFRALLAPALDCLGENDLRCVELELDALAASYELSSSRRAALDRIYGFVHFRRGNYQQAIEAYRRANVDGHVTYAPSLMVVARLHYELAQYQQALDAAVEYLRVAPSPTADDYAFVDRLRRLGAVVR